MDSPDQEITTELLVQAIEGGDKYVEQKMAERYEVIGEAIVNTAYMLNPEAIFLEAWTARCPAVHPGYRRTQNGQLRIEQLASEHPDPQLQMHDENGRRARWRISPPRWCSATPIPAGRSRKPKSSNGRKTPKYKEMR